MADYEPNSTVFRTLVHCDLLELAKLRSSCGYAYHRKPVSGRRFGEGVLGPNSGPVPGLGRPAIGGLGPRLGELGF